MRLRRASAVRRFVTSLPFALITSVSLVVLGSVSATSPATADHWYGPALAAIALFLAMVSTGSAIRRRRNRRP